MQDRKDYNEYFKLSGLIEKVFPNSSSSEISRKVEGVWKALSNDNFLMLKNAILDLEDMQFGQFVTGLKEFDIPFRNGEYLCEWINKPENIDFTFLEKLGRYQRLKNEKDKSLKDAKVKQEWDKVYKLISEFFPDEIDLELSRKTTYFLSEFEKDNFSGLKADLLTLQYHKNLGQLITGLINLDIRFPNGDNLYERAMRQEDHDSKFLAMVKLYKQPDKRYELFKRYKSLVTTFIDYITYADVSLTVKIINPFFDREFYLNKLKEKVKSADNTDGLIAAIAKLSEWCGNDEIKKSLERIVLDMYQKTLIDENYSIPKVFQSRIEVANELTALQGKINRLKIDYNNLNKILSNLNNDRVVNARENAKEAIEKFQNEIDRLSLNPYGDVKKSINKISQINNQIDDLSTNPKKCLQRLKNFAKEKSENEELRESLKEQLNCIQKKLKMLRQEYDSWNGTLWIVNEQGIREMWGVSSIDNKMHSYGNTVDNALNDFERKIQALCLSRSTATEIQKILIELDNNISNFSNNDNFQFLRNEKCKYDLEEKENKQKEEKFQNQLNENKEYAVKIKNTVTAILQKSLLSNDERKNLIKINNQLDLIKENKIVDAPEKVKNWLELASIKMSSMTADIEKRLKIHEDSVDMLKKELRDFDTSNLSAAQHLRFIKIKNEVESQENHPQYGAIEQFERFAIELDEMKTPSSAKVKSDVMSSSTSVLPTSLFKVSSIDDTQKQSENKKDMGRRIQKLA